MPYIKVNQADFIYYILEEFESDFTFFLLYCYDKPQLELTTPDYYSYLPNKEYLNYSEDYRYCYLISSIVLIYSFTYICSKYISDEELKLLYKKYNISEIQIDKSYNLETTATNIVRILDLFDIGQGARKSIIECISDNYKWFTEVYCQNILDNFNNEVLLNNYMSEFKILIDEFLETLQTAKWSKKTKKFYLSYEINTKPFKKYKSTHLL